MMAKSVTYKQQDGSTERDQWLDGRLVESIVEGFRVRIVALLAFPSLPSW